ncbi:MAG TPA: flagellar motor protein MotB [Cyanobacteria bacterium UBA9579]|nr:flagellar motor protein MotB [Cyanobacteria bacterium UBA9579]
MLLALFMVMYALSQIDINNVKDFSDSMDKAFEIPVVQQKTINNPQKTKILEEKRSLLKTFSTTEARVEMQNVDISDQKVEINSLKTQIKSIESSINKDAVEFKNIENLIEKNLGNIGEISVSRETRGLIIRLKDTVLFDPGSDIIKDNAQVTLDKLAGILREIPNSIRIEGHTDSQPINTPRFPSNWELSTARATNIIKYLINQHNINPQKFSAVGYGEYMPLKESVLEDNQSINRRVDIVILSSATKIFEPESNIKR